MKKLLPFIVCIFMLVMLVSCNRTLTFYPNVSFSPSPSLSSSPIWSPVIETEAPRTEIADDRVTGVWVLSNGADSIEFTNDFMFIGFHLQNANYKIYENNLIEILFIDSNGKKELTSFNYEVSDDSLYFGTNSSSYNKYVRPVPVSLEPVIEKKINFDDYHHLSSEKASYWFVRNKSNQPVAVKISDILDKYGCIYKGDPAVNKVYFTTDMGYESGVTSYLLDFYKENNIKIMFFITGDYISGNEALIQRMIDEGHMIGNHTCHHPVLPTVSLEKAYDEINSLDNRLFELFGIRSKFVRFPEGAYSEQILALVKDMGMTPVFWSSAFDDWARYDERPPSYFYQRITENMHNGALILLHAVNYNEALSLPEVIKYISDHHYEVGDPHELFK